MNGFDELRELAQDVCKEEIYERLAEKDALKKLVERGMPLKVLDELMCEPATVIMEERFSKNKFEWESESSYKVDES